MRASPSRRAAAAAQTLAVALAVSAVVVGVSYGLQRGLLRPPTHGELVAARIEAVLLRYHYIASTVHVGNAPVQQAECLEGWEPRSEGRPAGRGARVLFSDGGRLILGDRQVIRLRGSPSRNALPPVAEVQLAGCARSLTNHLYNHLVAKHRTYARPATFLGRPALAVHVRTKVDRFDLLVDPHTLTPIGLRLAANGIVAWSSLRPVPLRPALKRSFFARFDG